MFQPHSEDMVELVKIHYYDDTFVILPPFAYLMISN